jgi:hypothetical protein
LAGSKQGFVEDAMVLLVEESATVELVVEESATVELVVEESATVELVVEESATPIAACGFPNVKMIAEAKNTVEQK